jgi:hypothetical protein
MSDLPVPPAPDPGPADQHVSTTSSTVLAGALMAGGLVVVAMGVTMIWLPLGVIVWGLLVVGAGLLIGRTA